MLERKRGLATLVLGVVLSVCVSAAFAAGSDANVLRALGKARSKAIAKQFQQNMRIVIGGPCYCYGIDPIVKSDLQEAGMEVLDWPDAPMLSPTQSPAIGTNPMLYNVIIFGDSLLSKNEPHAVTGEIPQRFKNQISRLRRFLEAGGGVWFCGLGEQDWGRTALSVNYMLKELNLDAKIAGESVMDTASGVRASDPIWVNVMPDELTKGVKNLLHPHASVGGEGSMGVVPIVKLGAEWRVLVKARATAASFPCDPTVPEGKLLTTPGKVKSSPILCAVRQVGKGRVVLWPSWSNLTITAGSGGPLFDGEKDGKRSNGARLIENLLCWLAEPSQSSKVVATFDPEKHEAPRRELNISKALRDWARPGRRSYGNLYKGLIGAHSNLTDGKSSPEEMIAAATDAGYRFIAFTENFAQMDEAKWKKLMAICDKANAAAPGILINGHNKYWSSRQNFSKPVRVEYKGVHLKLIPRSPCNTLGFGKNAWSKTNVIWAFDGSTGSLAPLLRSPGKDGWRESYKKCLRMADLPDLTKKQNAVDLRIDWWPGRRAEFYFNGKLIRTYTKDVPAGPLPIGVRDETAEYRIEGIKVTRIGPNPEVLLDVDFNRGDSFDTKKTWEVSAESMPVLRKTPRILAYPGLDFMDEAGNRGVVFGHRYWIKDEWRSKEYPDRIRWWYYLAYGADSQPAHWAPRVIIRSQTNNKRPWNQGLWSFLGAYCYEAGKLVDDSFHEWRRVIGPHVGFMNSGLMAVHTVYSTDEIAASARPGLFQTYVWASNLPEVLGQMRNCVGPWPNGTFPTCVSAGPEILDFARFIADLSGEGGFPLEPYQDRGLLHILVRSEAGLKSVEVYDGERLIRRYMPSGKSFEKFMPFHPEEAHIFSMTITDRQGNKAHSWCAFAQVQHMMHRRCGDNWNWMPPGGRGPGTLKKPVFGFHLLEVTAGWRPRYITPEPSPQKVPHVRYINPDVNYAMHGPNATQMGAILAGHQNLLVDGKPWRTHWPAASVNVRTIGRFGAITGDNIRHELIIKGNVEPYTIGAFCGPYKVVAVPWPSDLLGYHPMNKPDGPVQLSRYSGKVKFTANVSQAKGGTVAVRVGSPNEIIVPSSAATIEVRRADGRVEHLSFSKGHNVSGKIPVNGYVAWYGKGSNTFGGVISLEPGLFFSIFTSGGAGYLVISKPVSTLVKPGTEVTFDTFQFYGTNPDVNSNERVMDIWKGMGVAGEPTLYSVDARVGRVTDHRVFLTLESEDGGFSGKLTKTTEKPLPIRLPVMVSGLNTRWTAAIWYRGKTKLHTCGQYRDRWTGTRIWRWIVADYKPHIDMVYYIPVLDDGTGYCQVETDKQDPDVFIGNPLVCDQSEVFIGLINVEKGKCEFEINNPTDRNLTCTVRPAKGFELTGEWQKKIALPAGGWKEVSVGPN